MLTTFEAREQWIQDRAGHVHAEHVVLRRSHHGHRHEHTGHAHERLEEHHESQHNDRVHSHEVAARLGVELHLDNVTSDELEGEEEPRKNERIQRPLVHGLVPVQKDQRHHEHVANNGADLRNVVQKECNQEEDCPQRALQEEEQTACQRRKDHANERLLQQVCPKQCRYLSAHRQRLEDPEQEVEQKDQNLEPQAFDHRQQARSKLRKLLV
mmetsp:Transcript_56684/g.132473  ORF Transcript_56684/g.132473 Transcript_56684/m.132473 type:complete len:212 (+) Transcript_56684:164-799(+)